MNNVLKRCLAYKRLLYNTNAAVSNSCCGNRNGRILCGSTSFYKNFSSLPNEETNTSRKLPQLMDFPEVLWPSVLNTIKNFITVNFIIRPYFDQDFQIKDFIFGAKQALQVVSSKLVSGDLTTLQHLVSTEAINELTPVIQKLSMVQRKQLEVNVSDIYLSFPYQIGILFEETNDKIQKRWVEITMVFHVMRGLTEMRERGEEIPWNMGTMPEYREKVFICNYRFIKEFTAGQQSDWTVNVVNQFNAVDLLNEN